MPKTIYEFDAVIIKEPDSGGAYVHVPLDIKSIFGKHSIKVHATFDGIAYDGLVLKMGTPEYIIGIRKSIRTALKKQPGDSVHVTLTKRNC